MLLQTFALALIVFLLAIAGMAVGVIFSGRRLTGSCGGLSAIRGIDQCGVCGRDLKDNSQPDCTEQDLKKDARAAAGRTVRAATRRMPQRGN